MLSWFSFLFIKTYEGNLLLLQKRADIFPSEKQGGLDMTETNKKMNKKLIGGFAALVAVIAVFVVLFVVFREKPVVGSKAISIEVVDKTQTSVVYEVKTDAEYLRQAMEEADGLTFSGEEGPYGLAISTVNGERADYTLDGAYWGFFVNGEYCNYGIDTQPVLDGDQFSIVYTLAQ